MVFYPNGQAPRSALVSYEGCVFSPDVYRRVRYAVEYIRARGGRITLNEGYRDLAGQVYQRQQWCARGKCSGAAIPGTSNHGDWNIGAVDCDSPNTALRHEAFGLVGMRQTISDESWHFAVVGPAQVDLSSFAGEDVVAIKKNRQPLLGGVTIPCLS